jgi:hypothetical protein
VQRPASERAESEGKGAPLRVGRTRPEAGAGGQQRASGQPLQALTQLPGSTDQKRPQLVGPAVRAVTAPSRATSSARRACV